MFEPRNDDSDDRESGRDGQSPWGDSDSGGDGGGGGTATLTFDVETVTGSKNYTVSFQPEVHAGAATKALAARMGLAPGTPYALRSSRSTKYLDDSRPLGEQITPGEKVTVTPKAHLG